MFVKIKSVEFSLFRDTQGAGEVDGIHHGQSNSERCQRDDSVPNDLRFEKGPSAAVEQARERSRVVRRDRTSGAILAASKQAERPGSPDTAEAVYRNRADGIIDA